MQLYTTRYAWNVKAFDLGQYISLFSDCRTFFSIILAFVFLCNCSKRRDRLPCINQPSINILIETFQLTFLSFLFLSIGAHNMNTIVQGFVVYDSSGYDVNRRRFASCETHSSELKSRIYCVLFATELSTVYKLAALESRITRTISVLVL